MKTASECFHARETLKTHNPMGSLREANAIPSLTHRVTIHQWRVLLLRRFKVLERLAVVTVPKVDDPRRRTGGEDIAVGSDVNAMQPGIRPAEIAEIPGVERIVHADHAVSRTGDDVVGFSHESHRRDVLAEVWDGDDLIRRVRIPGLDGLIRRCGNERLPVA